MCNTATPNNSSQFLKKEIPVCHIIIVSVVETFSTVETCRKRLRVTTVSTSKYNFTGIFLTLHEIPTINGYMILINLCKRFVTIS